MNSLKSRFFAIALTLSVFSGQCFEVYVSPQGNDSNSGTKESPVATLSGAQSVVRHHKSIRHNVEPITVWIAQGEYYQKEPLVFSDLDSGDKDNPVIWRAIEGEEVNILGGVSLPANKFTRVTNPAIRKRLSSNAVDKIVQIDLKSIGITDYGSITQYGHSISVTEAPLELFFNNQAMTLARYPNKGEIRIGQIIETGSTPRTGDYTEKGGSFHYTDERHARWVGQDDVWFQGTFNYGYADDNILVEKIDPKQKSVKMAFAHLYGLGSGKEYQSYYAYNILDELDIPGEWYLDRKTGILYFYPPSNLNGGDIKISILEEPIICLEGVHHLQLCDLIIECGRGIGVYQERSHHTLIAGCTIRNVGTSGVFMGMGAEQTFPHTTVDHYQGRPISRHIGNLKGHVYKYTHWDRMSGNNNGVVSCDIYNTGAGGVCISGGDKPKLIPANNYVENCKITNFTRRNKFLWAGVMVYGCGNRVRHCEIYNSDWQGIYVAGNDHIFEYNYIHDMTLNSNDTSPWYIGRDPSNRGNIVRYNRFERCGNKDRMTMGIYCDDSSTDVNVYGNLFVDMQTVYGVLFSNTGWDLKFKGNIVINPVGPTVMISSHYYTWAWAEAKNCFGPKGLLRTRLMESVNIYEPPYSDRYPELINYLDPIVEGQEWEGMRPRRNVATGNLIVGGAENPLSLNGKYAECTFENNLHTYEDPGFVDMKGGDYNLKPDSKVFQSIKNFEPLPIDRMGLYMDKYRKTID